MTPEPMGDEVAPGTAQLLRTIAGAMGAGLALMAGLVAWSYFNAAGTVPEPKDVFLTNRLTAVLMVVALMSIIASEILWRTILRKSKGPLTMRVQTAFIARLACREAAGLAGLTAAYLAAINGVLKLYPAYWINLAPFALFLVFLATHWPTVQGLDAEAREILRS